VAWTGVDDLHWESGRVWCENVNGKIADLVSVETVPFGCPYAPEHIVSYRPEPETE